MLIFLVLAAWELQLQIGCKRLKYFLKPHLSMCPKARERRLPAPKLYTHCHACMSWKWVERFQPLSPPTHPPTQTLPPPTLPKSCYWFFAGLTMMVVKWSQWAVLSWQLAWVIHIVQIVRWFEARGKTSTGEPCQVNTFCTRLLKKQRWLWNCLNLGLR